jgi:hypothetical protein
MNRGATPRARIYEAFNNNLKREHEPAEDIVMLNDIADQPRKTRRCAQLTVFKDSINGEVEKSNESSRRTAVSCSFLVP